MAVDDALLREKVQQDKKLASDVLARAKKDLNEFSVEPPVRVDMQGTNLPAIRDHYDERDRTVGRSPEDQAARTKTFLSDKLYALDRDKAEFCYQLLPGYGCPPDRRDRHVIRRLDDLSGCGPARQPWCCRR